MSIKLTPEPSCASMSWKQNGTTLLLFSVILKDSTVVRHRLPEAVRGRLLHLEANRINNAGELVLSAQEQR